MIFLSNFQFQVDCSNTPAGSNNVYNISNRKLLFKVVSILIVSSTLNFSIIYDSTSHLMTLCNTVRARFLSTIRIKIVCTVNLYLAHYYWSLWGLECMQSEAGLHFHIVELTIHWTIEHSFACNWSDLAYCNLYFNCKYPNIFHFLLQNSTRRICKFCIKQNWSCSAFKTAICANLGPTSNCNYRKNMQKFFRESKNIIICNY